MRTGLFIKFLTATILLLSACTARSSLVEENFPLTEEEISGEQPITQIIRPSPEPPEASKEQHTASDDGEHIYALRETYANDDIVGYLHIPGTSIDYPVVQSGDNEYYLDYNIHKERDSAGWVFLDYENDTERNDGNTIIYGHNMKSDIMFHSLRYYNSEEYFKNHRIITFNTEYAEQQWEVFTFFRTKTDFQYTRVFFPTEIHYEALVLEMKARSMYDTGVEVNANDRILTLSTCVSSGADDERYVLAARLIK